MEIEALKRRFTVEEFHRMVEAGILQEDDRVELIDGEILQKTPIEARHAACVTRLHRLFMSLLGERAQVRAQNPIILDDSCELQPDLALVRPRADDYASGHPRPKDVLLIVEVAESSIAYDRLTKLPLYARARVDEVWLVNLVAHEVEIHLQPGGPAIRGIRTVGRSQTIAPSALPDCRLSIDQILGAS